MKNFRAFLRAPVKDDSFAPIDLTAFGLMTFVVAVLTIILNWLVITLLLLIIVLVDVCYLTYLYRKLVVPTIRGNASLTFWVVRTQERMRVTTSETKRARKGVNNGTN